MNRNGHHHELPLARKPQQPKIPIELIRIQPNSGAAFSLACQASGLDDKEIYLTCGIDAGTFSRIKKGDATLQAADLANFCATVGNRVYPEWQAYQIGCTLTMIRSESERRADEAELRAKKAEAENTMLKSLLVGRPA